MNPSSNHVRTGQCVMRRVITLAGSQTLAVCHRGEIHQKKGSIPSNDNPEGVGRADSDEIRNLNVLPNWRRIYNKQLRTTWWTVIATFAHAKLVGIM